MKGKVQIFYTDDDQDDQRFFAEAVKELEDSVDVLFQNNGFELIDQLHSPPPSPDLIFLDLNMPGKNGYEALTEIRQNSRTKSIPVIIFSTSDDDGAIKTTRDLGANMYIPKPTNYSAIKKVIRHTLGIDWTIFRPGDGEFVYRGS